MLTLPDGRDSGALERTQGRMGTSSGRQDQRGRAHLSTSLGLMSYFLGLRQIILFL